MVFDKGKDQDKILTLRRSGSFEVGWQTHKAQCGAYGERMMTFDVTVRGRETDCPQGWLMDNNDVPNYFARKYRRVRVFKSCEQIASVAIDDLRRVCNKYKAKPLYIRVAVSGIKLSEIACEWEVRRHDV